MLVSRPAGYIIIPLLSYFVLALNSLLVIVFASQGYINIPQWLYSVLTLCDLLVTIPPCRLHQHTVIVISYTGVEWCMCSLPISNIRIRCPSHGEKHKKTALKATTEWGEIMRWDPTEINKQPSFGPARRSG